MNNQKFYIKSLNPLKVIAVFGVLFHHLKLYKFRIDKPDFYNTFLRDFIGSLGKNMVDVFFVLSGFLRKKTYCIKLFKK